MDRSRSGKIVGPFSFDGAGFFIVSDYPARPISRSFGEVVPSEEAPEGWRGSWFWQFAAE
jgi:hypothetical protein